MLVQHMAGYIKNDIAVNTRDFFDMGVKLAYDFKLYKTIDLQLSAGVQNVFNAYQNDFDQGVERDSGYLWAGCSAELFCRSKDQLLSPLQLVWKPSLCLVETKALSRSDGAFVLSGQSLCFTSAEAPIEKVSL